MLNILPESDCRSVTTRVVLQRKTDCKAPNKDYPKPQDEQSNPCHDKKALQRKVTNIRGTHIAKYQGFQVMEQEAGLLQPQTTHYLSDITTCAQSPEVTEDLVETLSSHARFHQAWRHHAQIGEGGDGVVHLFKQSKPRGKYIAIKFPLGFSGREVLRREIKNMHILGRHDHILELSHATEDWYPYGPVLFVPYCRLGNLATYRRSWCEQQQWEGQPARVSEITMYKLFRDMVLALNYLHNELGTRYVHNDFKPANVLVEMSPDQPGDHVLPEEPIFKLADFARLTPWPTLPGHHPQRYDGTPEYAPPHHEQLAPVHPSADVWGLGATLQYMALGIQPVQSRESFARSRKAKGLKHPDLMDEHKWASESWRYRIPTVFRPIHVSLKTLQEDHDLVYDLPDYQPYGIRLGCWYAQLWNPVSSRPKTSTLVVQAIPFIDHMIEHLKGHRLKQLELENGQIE